MSDKREIEYAGKLWTSTELEEVTGVERRTIADRWKRGYRGDDLVFAGKFNKFQRPNAPEPVSKEWYGEPALFNWICGRGA